jgi:hypothetical protein
MATKRTPTANVTLRRPAQPITRPQLLEALAPLLELVQADAEDVRSINITPGTIRLQVVPRSRGKRQLDSLLRVSYPVTTVEED